MMAGQLLKEARLFEENEDKRIRQKDRPAFHLSSRAGWMNDPNGFSYYGGKYHLFYQYHPFEKRHGLMYWAHAVSDDLLHWEYLPAALAPDEEYDRAGCFSGSAVEMPDGRHLLMYTGVQAVTDEGGMPRVLQTQCLAVGDGVDYEKYEGNPVLDGGDLPEDASCCDFRDPKIWRKPDGTYRSVVGNRPGDGSGQILLFMSPDGFHWSFQKVFARNRNRFGRMWECPDFFELDGKGVLLVSPQQMFPGCEYSGTLCLIGAYDPATDDLAEENDQAVDCGLDFYAPQTALLPDGRRVMIGWMQSWETCGGHRGDLDWFGQMTLPRELSVRNGRLCQKPVRELEKLRRGRTEYRDVVFDGELNLAGIRGRKTDMELEIAPADGEKAYREFAVRFAANEMCRTSVSFRPEGSVLKVDRGYPGSGKMVVHQRCCRVNSDNGKLKLRIVLDWYSVEVFVNDGEQALTAVFYTDRSADGISFFADGPVKMNVVKYELAE